MKLILLKANLTYELSQTTELEKISLGIEKQEKNCPIITRTLVKKMPPQSNKEGFSRAIGIKAISLCCRSP